MAGVSVCLKSLWRFNVYQGFNRFIFHRLRTSRTQMWHSMTMGPWGIHFDRTITWWKPGKAWLNYVARCQHILQQGLFNADLLYYTNADAPGQDLSNRPSPSPEPPQVMILTTSTLSHY